MREVVNGLMYILSTGCSVARDPEGPVTEKLINGYFDLWT